jgi:hypothetical protein
MSIQLTQRVKELEKRVEALEATVRRLDAPRPTFPSPNAIEPLVAPARKTITLSARR